MREKLEKRSNVKRESHSISRMSKKIVHERTFFFSTVRIAKHLESFKLKIKYWQKKTSSFSLGFFRLETCRPICKGV